MKIQLIIFALFAVISTAFTQCTPPCVNGSCQPGNACRCNTGWTDSRCDVALCTGFGTAQCGPGKCVAPDVCNCTGTEYTGEACTIPICPTPCQNGGICNAPDSCNCAGTGYTGKYCDAPICNAPIGCGPGTCIAAEVCDCDDGWTGTYCTTPVCPTACENGGKCIGPDTCDCKGTGYDGKYCTTPVCDPGCLNGGECVLPDVCDCSNITGWTGDYCEQGICDNAPCQHGGRCVAPDECNCTATGYSGLQCQNEIDECSNATSPCYPGTSCTNTPGNFTCSACPSGYTGTGRLIDNGGCTDIDECLTLCDPVADCNNTPGSFTCGACPSGYTGTGLTGCVAICDNACVNGNCTAPNRCTCQPGWTGPTCNVQGPSTTGTVTGTTGVPTNSTTDGTDDEDLTESSASFVTFSVVAFFASLFFVL